jgi:spermidine synthase
MSTRRRTSTTVRGPKLAGILTCFFLSGSASLIDQVAWAKALGLIFGHTAYAVATVLAVFMAGLAAGSAYLGRWGEGHRQPIALYARIEFLVGATAALSLPGLAGVRSLYIAAYPVLGGSPPLLLALRFFGAAAVLLIPTFLMGGTLPILVSSVAKNSTELGIRLSQLYSVNTLGAVAGTLMAGFVLLPGCGLRLTIACAVAMNILAGLLALRISNETRGAQDPARALWQTTFSGSELAARPSRFLLFLFAIVGATAFAYEIAWTRLLAITIGSSTYAFTLMLASFLAGTVMGSRLFQRFLAGSAQISLRTFSGAQLAIGIGAVSSLALYHWIPAVVPPLLRATDRTFSGLLLAQFVASALTLLPLATVFGFNFPLVVVLLDRSTESRGGGSSTVGTAYSANTVGAIIGSVLVGFWLVPWLGSFRVIVGAAVVNVLLALGLDWRRQPRVLSLALDLACLLIAFAIAFSTFFYNRSLLSLSAVLYGNSYEGRLTLAEVAATKDLVFSAEGANDSVAVVRTDSNVALRINGKVDASTDDARTQLLLGHLGAAFHPLPRRVLIIGFGSGMTAAAVSAYPDVEKIDCVEIEPAVIRAAPYLESLNRNVLQDHRLHVIFDDARNFLLTTREKYDLIISEPSNPWIAGIATLFTTEYYAAARRRLAPGGIFVQWVQAYAIAPADLRMITATYASQFPEVTLWRAGETDLLMLARTDLSPFQFGHLRSVWDRPVVRADFESLDIHEPQGLVAYFLLDDAAVRKLAEGGQLNTDDRTLLEYHSPRSLLAGDLIDADQDLIARFRTSPLPANLEARERSEALEAGASTALDLNDGANARNFLEALKSQPESARQDLARGRLALLEGSLPAAEHSLEAALRLDPDSLEAMHWLAIAEQRNGDDSSAGSRVAEILQRNPHFLPALDDEMYFAVARRDFRTALSAQLTRLAVIPDPPAYEYCRLGGIWIALSDVTDAESTLLKGLQKDPYSYACHLELGELYQRTGQLPRARENFEWVVRFFPAAEATVFRSLAEVDVVLGDRKSAHSVLSKGYRLFPEDAELQKAAARLGP